MTIPFGYIVPVLFIAAAVASALWPRSTHGPRATPTFALGTVASEAPFVLAWYLILVTWVASSSGDLDSLVGRAASGLAALTLVGLAWIVRQSARAPAALEAALTATLGEDRPRAGRTGHRLRSAWALTAPLRLSDPRIRRERNLAYGPAGRANRLDLYRRRDVTSGPVFAYFHGGGFHSGSKNRQAKLLLETLALHGWVCVSADYRLRTEYLNSLIDAKRVIAWLRTEGVRHGADPGTLVVAGGSAGAHLAVNCSLSAGQSELQPGFEEVDTSVAAVVGLYGYYGRAFGQTPSAPADFTGSGLPPLMVVHGPKDPMASIGPVRELVGEMRARGEGPVVYAELPGAVHNFDLFASLRHAAVTTATLEFVTWVRGRAARQTADDAPIRARS